MAQKVGRLLRQAWLPRRLRESFQAASVCRDEGGTWEGALKLAIVTGSYVGPCPWCRKKAGFVELRQGEAKWQRIEPHGCTAVTALPERGAALSDPVDAEVFGDGGVA